MPPYLSILLNSSSGIHLHGLQTMSGALNLILTLKRLKRGMIHDKLGYREIESEAGVGLMASFSLSPLASLVAINYQLNIQRRS